MADTPEKVRITVDLPADAAAQLKELALSRGVTMTEAIRGAISMDSFVNEKVQSKAKILIEENGKIREVIVRR